MTSSDYFYVTRADTSGTSVSGDKQGYLIMASDLNVPELPLQHPLQAIEGVYQIMHDSSSVIELERETSKSIMACLGAQDSGAIEYAILCQVGFQVRDRCLFLIHRAGKTVQQIEE